MANKLSPVLLVSVLILLTFLGLVLFQFLGRGDAEPEYLPVPVVLGKLEREDLQETINFSGNLRPESSVLVIPKVSGRILEIPVREGDVVREDQVLAVLDDQVLELQAGQAFAAWQGAESQYQKALEGARPEEVENARASLAQAEKDLETARSNLTRTSNLFEAGAISRAQYEEAVSGFEGAQTQVENARRSLSLLVEGARAEDVSTARSQAEAAQRQYELARLQLSYAQVTSPVSGRIADVLADVGNLAGPQSPLFALVSEDTIFAGIALPESLYGRFLLNADEIRAKVRPIAYPGEPAFEGRVSRVASVIDAATRTFEVEVGVDNRGNLLRPGMYVNVEFTLNTLESATTLPVRAVLDKDGASAVFVFEADPDSTAGREGWARLRTVETGGRTRTRVQVVSGLGETEQVIVEGNSFLEDGQRVRLAGGSQ